MKSRLLCFALSALLPLSGPLLARPSQTAQVPEQVSNAAWEQDIRHFEEADAAQPPPKQAVLFIGSSSIRMWSTLSADFPGLAVINRGFGGSELRDSTWYADRIALPYAPRTIVLYAGDNDLAAGRSPTQVRDDFVAFVERIRRDLPSTRIVYLSIKPSPSRSQLAPAMIESNRLIRTAAAQFAQVDYVDVYQPMLDAHGQPRAELFQADKLHMTADGYHIWRDALTPLLAH